MKAPQRPKGGWPWEGKPGYFTELIRAHNWPPGWKPQELGYRELDDFGRSLTAAKAREVQVMNGHTGAIPGLSGKADKRLGDHMGAKKLLVHK